MMLFFAKNILFYVFKFKHEIKFISSLVAGVSAGVDDDWTFIVGGYGGGVWSLLCYYWFSVVF